MADHDRLCDALAAYEIAPAGFGGVERQALAGAAAICGWPGDADLIEWSRSRAESYRRTMARSVNELASAIAVTNSLERAIGLGEPK